MSVMIPVNMGPPARVPFEVAGRRFAGKGVTQTAKLTRRGHIVAGFVISLTK
jgi:hypothetical protein